MSRDQAIRAERHASSAKSEHDKMEEMVTDMEVYVDEVKALNHTNEIETMKEEIKILKNTVKHLTGIIEKIGQSLGV